MGGAIPGLHASPGPGGVPPTSGSGPPLVLPTRPFPPLRLFLTELN